MAKLTRALAACLPWSYTVAVIVVLPPAEISVLLADRLMLLGDCTVTGTSIAAPEDRTKLSTWLPLLALLGRLNAYPLKLPARMAAPVPSSVVSSSHLGTTLPLPVLQPLPAAVTVAPG